MTLVFASANKNKIREISLMLPKSYLIKGLGEIGISEDIPETGTTIKENSFLKASYVSDYLRSREINMPVFADDSGLEVNCLHGAPGVYSARYAGAEKNDKANNEKLLQALKNQTDRTARFVTVITYLYNNEVLYFEGEVKGTIAHELKGDNGFGYDPLFIPRGYRSTFGELSLDAKNTISHRADAVKKFISFLDFM